MEKQNPVVMILIGSDSDLTVIKPAIEILQKFEIPFEIELTSAHRSPERTSRIVREAPQKGIKIFIIGAGMAAHLGGVVAAETTLPVIAVPINSGPLNGLDALYSIVQMPMGVPVAAMSIGKAGAGNAAVFAAEILALSDERIQKKLKEYKKELARKVDEKSKEIKKAFDNF